MQVEVLIITGNLPCYYFCSGAPRSVCSIDLLESEINVLLVIKMLGKKKARVVGLLYWNRNTHKQDKDKLVITVRISYHMSNYSVCLLLRSS